MTDLENGQEATGIPSRNLENSGIGHDAAELRSLRPARGQGKPGSKLKYTRVTDGPGTGHHRGFCKYWYGWGWKQRIG